MDKGIVQDLQTALVKLRQSDRRRDAQYTDVTAIESLRSSTSGWTFHDPLQTPFSFMGRHLNDPDVLIGETKPPHVQPVDINTKVAIVPSTSCATTAKAHVQSAIPLAPAAKPRRVHVKAVRPSSFAATPARAPVHVDRLISSTATPARLRSPYTDPFVRKKAQTTDEYIYEPDSAISTVALDEYQAFLIDGTSA
ncbi:hypothetical protein ACOSQ2_010064 [Xanthoceras sorbifolium]